jgi:hypothetical protein
MYEAQDAFDGSGFAGTIGSKQTEYLPLFDFQGDVIQRLNLFRDEPDFENLRYVANS